MAILRMYQGEKRKLYLTVKSEDDLPFEITGARYEVWNCDTDEREADGTCEIDDHVLPCTMQAQTTGLHEIRFFIQIAGEEIIRTIHVAVGKT